MFYKYITHSDLTTSGKATKPNKLYKNLLYYIDMDEMKQIEVGTQRPFQTAHQSNIGLSLKVYDKLGIPRPREVDNENNNHQYNLNDYANVYIEKNNVKYFVSKYTTRVFDKLNKTYNKNDWSSRKIDIEIEESFNSFQEIGLHCAVHGIGMKIDDDFHKLRHNLFKGDGLVFLCELRNNQKPNVFILFEKNPIFYNLIGEINSSYLKYQQMIQRKTLIALSTPSFEVDEEADEVTRSLQSSWRDTLAKEMMGYTQFDRQVMCPFTYIQADYDNLGTLYRASHIKGFKDPNTTNDEKYDINNGLLLCSNADSLFDKHLITVGENKELIFSYLLDGNQILKQQLLLTTPIFKAVLNDERMKYLSYHRNKFYELEHERRTRRTEVDM